MQIKNKKQILTTILSVLVSVFLVAGIAYAVTTISGTTITLEKGETISNTTDGTIDFGAANLKTTGTLSGLSQIYINNATNTGGALKIHSHQMAGGVEWANEFKGEFLGTTGTMDGIAAHYHMAASGDGVMRSILGVAYLDTGVTLSGTSATGSWISGILGSVNVAGVVNGTAVTVTGVYGGLGSMAGGTLTAVNDMSAIWADSQVIQVPSAGDSQLLLMTNGLGATLGQAIKIDANDRITNFVKFDNVDNMVTISGTSATGSPAKIKILIDNVAYYINAYPDSNN